MECCVTRNLVYSSQTESMSFMCWRSSVVTHIKASVCFEHETYREIVSACTALGLYCSGIGHLVLWWKRTIVLEELEHEKLRSHTQFWLEDFEGNTVGNQYILA